MASFRKEEDEVQSACFYCYSVGFARKRVEDKSSSGLWNYRLLASVLDRELALKICRTPTYLYRSDLLVWKGPKNKCFIVRSVSYIAINIKPRRNYVPPFPRFWKLILNLEVVPKIKIFLWRLEHQSLATRDALRRRGMDSPPYCPSVAFWSLLFPTLDPYGWENEDFFSWYFRMYELLYHDQWMMLNVALWIVWKNRNACWTNGFCSTSSSAVSLARQVVFLSTIFGKPPDPANMEGPTRWSPPPTEFGKVNCDAALFRSWDCWGLGMVIRIDQGNPLCYQSKFLEG
ncbi:uncharacterized protein [Rutidosis leptorrhynchoides]|uniref:uncharacterized protein n=1 Tax=Rutidosis leptorrhynchoides TaxID=125765 RepID=UPI003A9A4983